MNKSTTLYLIKTGPETYELVTEDCEPVASIVGDVYDDGTLLGLHTVAEFMTGSLVKIVGRMLTVTRFGGEVVRRATEDTDDPILNMLTRRLYSRGN